jgi:hypothetical protein
VLIFEDFSTLGMKKFPYLKTGLFIYLPTWRDFKINFSRTLFTIILFLVTDSILRVKPMYESTK